MSSGFDFLVNNLERRYDFQSARTMTRQALSAAGLKEQPNYSKEELQRFVDQLSQIGTHLDRVWGSLGAAPSGQPLPVADKPAAAPEAPAKAEAPAKQDEPAKEAAPEPKAEAKPEPEPAPDKAEAKPAKQEPEPKAEAADAKAEGDADADDKGGSDKGDKKKKK